MVGNSAVLKTEIKFMVTRIGILVVFIGALTTAAYAMSIRPNEPGPGGLNGPEDCVLVTGGNNKAARCPKTKYMRVCGAPNPQSDRGRSCVNS